METLNYLMNNKDKIHTENLPLTGFIQVSIISPTEFFKFFLKFTNFMGTISS